VARRVLCSVAQYMSLLDQAQSLLKRYDVLAPLVIGAIGSTSGWLLLCWKRWRDAKPSISVSSRENWIWLTNQGKLPVELLSANLTLRDMGSKPALARKHHIVIGVAGLVQPGESMKLTKISGVIVDTIAEIWEPHKRQIEDLGWSSEAPWWATCLLRLTCGAFGRRGRHVQVFERQLCGSPTLGWSLQRSPYDPEYPDPLNARIRHVLQSAWNWVRHPSEAYRNRQKFNFLGEQLEVRGLLRAMQEETIGVEQGFEALEKIAKRAGLHVADLIKRHVDLPEGIELAELKAALDATTRSR
jgi:hypothetical protein